MSKHTAYVEQTAEDEAINQRFELDINVGYFITREADELQSRILIDPVTGKPQFGHARKAQLRIALAHRGAGTSDHWMEVY